MSPATRRPLKTPADLAALPEGTWAELIAGEIYVTPSPTPRHQSVALRLGSLLLAYADRTASCRVFAAPCDVHLPGGHVVQPDVLLVRHTNDIVRDDAIHGPPDLVVEVLSPSNPMRDRLVKRDLYAQAGVSEYWIVDPEDEAIEVFRLEAGAYQPAGWLRGQDTVRSPLPPELEIPLPRIFA